MVATAYANPSTMHREVSSTGADVIWQYGFSSLVARFRQYKS